MTVVNLAAERRRRRPLTALQAATNVAQHLLEDSQDVLFMDAESVQNTMVHLTDLLYEIAEEEQHRGYRHGR
ncbi:hypothetical protein ACPCG0_11735 [Propionibacteriaceae bacterium Y1923]|uniref:hypothetical protein n=1 Tax=Aestuariimicrobium sp. Y1814 TaxID=3418742 RepID=UPI003C1B043E